MDCTQINFHEPESLFSAALSKNQEDIDFEAIALEEEYFYGCKEVSLNDCFIGEDNESTEIDSLLNSMTYDQSSMMNPFKLANNGEEILQILRRPQTSKNLEPARDFSRSNPEFYNTKKISLKGRVIKSESDINNNDLNIASSAMRVTRPVPVRVSNPFLKNFFQADTVSQSTIENGNNNNNKIL